MPTRLRVVDQVHDGGGNPVLDDKGRPLRNGGSYYGIKDGRPHEYLPGEIVELDDAAARRELAICGATHDSEGRPGRLPILELESAHLEREAKRQAAAQDRDRERNQIAEMGRQLEESAKQNLRLQEQIRVRELERLQGTPPPPPPPPDTAALLARIEALEKRAADAEARARAAEAQAAAKGGKGARA